MPTVCPVTPNGVELKLLQALYAKRGHTCNKYDLLVAMNNNSAGGSDDQLNGAVKRLREKLREPKGQPLYIERVWGTGFKLQNYAEPLLKTKVTQ